MPYRLDTYDAVASLAVTSDASTNRRSIATPTPSSVHTSAGWSADPTELAGRSSRGVPGRGTGAQEHGGSTNPRVHPYSTFQCDRPTSHDAGMRSHRRICPKGH